MQSNTYVNMPTKAVTWQFWLAVRNQSGRYISSNEAVWRILSFPIHKRSPDVVHLAVHLQNGQRVYFPETNVQQRALNPPDTKFTGFFSLCKNDSFAKKLLYTEVPSYYTWNTKIKVFERRTPIKMNASFYACFWWMYPVQHPLSIWEL